MQRLTEQCPNYDFRPSKNSGLHGKNSASSTTAWIAIQVAPRAPDESESVWKKVSVGGIGLRGNRAII